MADEGEREGESRSCVAYDGRYTRILSLIILSQSLENWNLL